MVSRSSPSLGRGGGPTGSVGKKLVGRWRLVSYLARPPRGEAVYPLGRAARGVLEYSPEGNVSVRITGARAFSYHGYYTVDRKAGILTHHLGLCSDHGLAGVSSLRHIGLEGERLVLSGSASLDGRPHALRVVWERQAE